MKCHFKMGIARFFHFIEDDEGIKVIAVFSDIEGRLADVDFVKIDKGMAFNSPYTSNQKKFFFDRNDKEKDSVK